VTEDREHDRTEERDGAARPVTAAARRERRASARDAAERDRTATAKSAERTSASSQARTKRAKAGDGEVVAADKKTRPTAKRDRAEKRPAPPARLLRFLREVVSELRKVIWPTRKQQITYTVVVLVFVAFVVALVYGLDAGFSKLVFTVFA
jgi:preprotein translocase subunit SecE